MMKVAVLGAGYFSQFHIDGWKRIPDAELVGVADLDIGRAQAAGAPAFRDLDAMLKTTEPDILDIVLPPTAHQSCIRNAAEYNLKAIICQKPFCNSLAEARETTAIAKENEIELIIHENFRFQPWFRAIKRAIDAGDIGMPLQGTFRLRPGDGQGQDAYLARQPYFRTMPRLMVHETGVHYIDTFRYLFGDPTHVYADLHRVNPAIVGEDAGMVLFDHGNGVRSILDGNRCLDHAAENTRCTMGEGLFEGTEGGLTLKGDGSVQFRRFGEMGTKTILGPNTSTNFGGDCTFYLQSHVVAALNGEFPLENVATKYLTVLEIEQAVYKSAMNHSRVTLNTNGSRPEQN